MTRWCAGCGSEYVEGVSQCPQCGRQLEESPPGSRRRGPKPFTAEDAIFIEPRAARTHSDPFVPVWEGPTTEGMTLVRRLESASIPVEEGEAAEPGSMRIEVPRSYLHEAYPVIESLGAPGGLTVPDDPSALTETDEIYDGEGWPAWGRYALVAVAIGLVLLLLL